MPVSNGRFSKPIRLKEDLANFFGLSANLGNIIVNGNINKWAKYKPVNWDGEIGIHSTNEKWYKGKNGMCGYKMVYGEGSLIPSMIKSVLGKNYDWEYERDTKAYRALDFDGYNHNSVKPFVSKIIDYLFNKNTSTDKAIIFSNQYNAGYNIEGNFILTDLEINGSSCANWYSGIIIADNSGNFVAGITSNTTISFDKDSARKASYVNISPSLVGIGTYNIIPIISSVKKYGENAVYSSNGGKWNDGIVAFLPIGTGMLSIVNAIDANVWYEVYTTNNGVVIQLYGNNNTDIPITITRINTYIDIYDRRADDEGLPDQWIQLYAIEGQDVYESIPANTKNFQFRNAGGEIQKSLINSPDWDEIHRVRVELLDNPELSGSSTEFRDDGEIWG